MENFSYLGSSFVFVYLYFQKIKKDICRIWFISLELEIGNIYC